MGVFSQLEKTRLVKKLKVARDRKRGTGADNKKVEGRKSHTELRPEVVAEAKRLRRASPKTGDRLSYRQISARLEAAGIVKRRGKIPDPMTDEQRAAALSRVRTSRASLAITGAPLLHKPSLGLLSNPNDPTPEWRSKVGHLIAQATIGKGDVVPQKQYRVKDTLEAHGSKFPIEIQLALAKFMADATHRLRIPVANWNGTGFLEPTSPTSASGQKPAIVAASASHAGNVVPSDQRFLPRDNARLSGVTPSNIGVTSAIRARTSRPGATRS